MSLYEAVAESAIGSATARFMGNSKDLNAATRTAGDLASGNFNALGRHILATGVLDKALGALGGPIRHALFWSAETPMFGGLSPSDAKKIHDKSVGVALAKKNLFLLEVSSSLRGDASEIFNLLASDVEYAPSTVSGEGKKVGSATVDSVQSGEPVDLSITTLDDAGGSIKNWFNAHVQACVHSDGTFGLPVEYAIRIKILHSFVVDKVGAYTDIGLYRPVNMPLSLSRREDAVQELALSFRQLDTFLRT